ncbi:acyl carrier protein [Streptomyces marianii]|uniref:Acyl carrier protein n=1 Tax=Streptomyces marianii TaxID=1817406 RepID=A0A5R9E8A3_9ACTN|nr:acyl carrier protein [Streptomyces marianii]TLQ46301.1 acyl carrier protein [Streptomyces marianii]
MPTERVLVDEEILSRLLDIAYDVLGIECDPQGNFFEYGDSLAATQMCSLATNRHGWNITARDVFAWESFTLLAGAIERDEAEREALERKRET